ncbi:MAG: hypothetical protein U1A22_08990 [Xanthomonadaceae bacterium]|nr:hypothetical protein [Xanthomonadaceae bacterium]
MKTLKTHSNSEMAREIVLPALAAALALALSGNAFSQADRRGPPFLPPGHALPAAKIVATSATLELLEAHLTDPLDPDAPVEPLVLLQTSFDIESDRQNDLLVRLDGECAAWVNAAAPVEEPSDPEDPAEEPLPEEPTPNQLPATASIVTWLELDGEPLPVSESLVGEVQVIDDGTVVFCQSGSGLDLTTMEQTETIIGQFQQSRTVDGFSWTISDLAPGFHELAVKARLEVGSETPDAPVGEEGEAVDAVPDAIAVFGKRVLVVEPTRIDFDPQPVPAPES